MPQPTKFGETLLLGLLSLALLGSAPTTYAATFTIGVVNRFATSSSGYSQSDETYTNYQKLAGLTAAVVESNSAGSLGSDSLSISLAATSGDGAAEIAAMTGITALAMPGANTYKAALAAAKSRAIPMVGADAGAEDVPALFALANNRNAINLRYNSFLEFRTLINYALNSRLRCRRFGILHSNQVNMTANANALAQILLDLALDARTVAYDPTTIAGGDFSVILQFYTIPTRIPQCLFLLTDQSYITSFVSVYQASSQSQPADTFYLIPSSSYHPRLAKVGSSLQNLFTVAQFPDPTVATTFTSVISFRSAMSTLISNNIMSGFSSIYGVVDTTPTPEQFEGYLLGRFMIEVLKRDPTSSGSGAVFLQNLFASKFIFVDDLTLGPFSDGCSGTSSVFGSPCYCNTGEKLMFVSQVNVTSQKIGAVPFDSSLGEQDNRVTVIPTTQCGPSQSNSVISIPFTFLQVRDTTQPAYIQSRMAYFAAITQILFVSLNAAFGGRTFVLVTSPIDMSASNPAALIDTLQLRYPALAWIGSSFDSATLARLGLQLPLVETDIITDSLTTDPPLSSWRKQQLFLNPTMAEYFHGMANFIASNFTSGQLSGGVGIIGTTRSEIPYARQSLNTFQVKVAFEDFALTSNDVTTLLQSRCGTSTSASCYVLVTARDASSIAYAMQYAATRAGVKMFLVTDEANVEASVHAVGINAHNIFFASQMPEFWDPTEPDVTVSGSFWKSIRGTPGAIIPNHVFIYKTFRLLMQLFLAGLDLSGTATTSLFFDSFYKNRFLQFRDETFGPFSADACPASVISANSVFRTCQCSKAIRSIYTFSALDWARLTPKASMYVNHLYTIPQTQCGIDYKPLEKAPLLSNDLIIIISGSGGGALILVIIIAVIAVSSKKTRDVSMAPKDTNKPFAIAFTDIQSSTNLWARAPSQMGEAVETHHELIRQIIKKRRGYEVKTVGDSFMVAFEDAKNAVLFAVDLQEKFQEYKWDPIIDQIYKDLAAEKLEAWEEENPGKPFPMESGGPDEVWGGVRVRIGINWGIGEVKFDETSLGYDYYGTVVNTAARIEASGHGGEIVISEFVFKEIAGEKPELGLPDITTKPQGSVLLRGLDNPIQLIQVIPASLAARQFGPLRLEVEQAEDSDEEGDDNGEKTSVGSTKSHQSVGAFRAMQVEVFAEKFCKRWKKGTNWGLAYRMTMQNYCCLKSLLATSNPKDRKQLLETLAGKWRVQLLPPKNDPQATEEAMYDHHLMQVVTKVTPSSEALGLSLMKGNLSIDEDQAGVLGSTAGRNPVLRSPSRSPATGNLNTSGMVKLGSSDLNSSL